MSSNGAIRKGAVFLGAGSVYVVACYIGYQAVENNRRDFEETEQVVKDRNFSFVTNPERTKQFQTVAEKYDDEVGRDESVMGMNILRRALLYFHASGTVLEVGAGTGRNIGRQCVATTVHVASSMFPCAFHLTVISFPCSL